MNGCVMTNNQVIPITDGVQKPKRGGIAVRAETGAKGIQLRIDPVPDSVAMRLDAYRQPMEVSDIADSIRFRGCSEVEAGDRSYWIAGDGSVGVLAAGQATLAGVGSFSGLEELTAVTSQWAMPQLVSAWNQLPGVRKLTRFENRSIALKRLWRALEGLPQQAPDPEDKPNPGKQKKQAVPSKSERLIGLLQTPGGVTLQALMEVSGWQAHSVRGFLSGKLSKQLGLSLESFRRDGERVYALCTCAPGAAAMAVAWNRRQD